MKINPDVRYQTVEGWGSSLCWWAHMVGQWSDEAKIDSIVTLITSPDRLNMNIFRYNIGGGDNPSHYSTDETPGHMASGKGVRAEMQGFKAAANAPYDWTADPGQRKMMLKIKEKRPDAIFEAFSNSPPYWMTYSGCSAGNTSAGSDNLKPEYYDAFCDYLIEVCKHYQEEHGIEFKTLEPFNESLTSYWGNKGGQEGCHFGTGSQMNLIRKLYPKLQASGLNTVISASDETSLNDFKTAMNAYINAGDILDKIGQVNTHTYSGSDPERVQVFNLTRQMGKTFWQSETGPMGMSGSGISNNLQLAQLLFKDMKYMHPVAWLDWQLMEEYNDTWCQMRCSFSEETYSIVRNFYVRMQVTRFIKQGYRIIESDNDNVLAALSPDGSELVVVLINNSGSTQSFDLDLSGFYAVNGPAKVFRTSSSENCKALADLQVQNRILSYSASNRTITTFVIPVRQIDYSQYRILSGITFEDDNAVGFEGNDAQINANTVTGLLNASSKCLKGDFTAGVAYRFEQPFIPNLRYRYLHVMAKDVSGTTANPDPVENGARMALGSSAGWKDNVFDLTDYNELDSLIFYGLGLVSIDNLIINDDPEERQVTTVSPFYDFESQTGTPVCTFRNAAGKTAAGSVIPNTDYAGINVLGKAFEYQVPMVATAGSREDTLIISLSSPLVISASTRYLHLMVKSSLSTLNVSVQSVSLLKNCSGNQWLDLVVDLNALEGMIVHEIKLSPSGLKNLNAFLYLDNICFTSESQAQAAEFKEPGKNPYVIVSRKSGLALAPGDGNVVQTTVNPDFEDNTQQWYFMPATGGYVISNLASDKVLTDANAYALAFEDKTENLSGQLFSVIPTDGGYARITSLATGKSLDVEGESSSVGVRIGLWDYGTSGNLHRQWALLEIKNENTGIVLQRNPDSPVIYTENGGLYLNRTPANAFYEIYQVNGMLIRKGTVTGTPCLLTKVPGIYIVRTYAGGNVFVLKGVL